MARHDSRSPSRRRGRPISRKRSPSVSRRHKRSVSRKRVPDVKPSRRVVEDLPVTKKKRSPSRRAASSESESESRDNDKRPTSPGSDFGEERMSITNDDAAFILGKGGKTKEKIARVCGAHLNLFEKDLVLEIRGSKRQRHLGVKYVNFVIAQRSGTVYLKDKDDDGDMSVLEIPQEAVGFVTGRNGNFLRTLEEEWGVLLLFVVREEDRGERSGRGRSRSGHRRRGKEETLVIFGERRGRRGAELKALSAIEAKCPGFFEAHREEILYRDKDEDWGVSTMEFKDDELAYALGRGGATRKKIEASSGCITQYLGNTAIFAGKEKDRRKAKQYTIWLFEQLNGPVFVKDYAERKDCTVLDIPSDCVGYVTGSHRAALGQMEDEFRVLMFFMGSKHDRKESEKLIIFGKKAGRKGAELKVMSTVETKARGFYTSSFREGKSTSSGFGTDVRKLRDDEISYALGARGSTRKKLQRAAGCIIQYIGNYAHIAGNAVERARANDYLNFLLDQRKGKVEVDDESRSDVLRVEVPSHCIGWVTGNKGQELRRVEEETGTFCFLAQDKYGAERMLVFGHAEGSKFDKLGRIGAKRLIEDLIEEKEHLDRTGRRAGGRRHDSRRSRSRRSPPRRSRSRGRFDSRSRSPPRRRRSRSRSFTPPRRGRTPPRRGRTPPRRGRSRSRSDSRSRSRGRGGRRR